MLVGLKGEAGFVDTATGVVYLIIGNEEEGWALVVSGQGEMKEHKNWVQLDLPRVEGSRLDGYTAYRDWFVSIGKSVH